MTGLSRLKYRPVYTMDDGDLTTAWDVGVKVRSCGKAKTPAEAVSVLEKAGAWYVNNGNSYSEGKVADELIEVDLMMTKEGRPVRCGHREAHQQIWTMHSHAYQRVSGLREVHRRGLLDLGKE